MSDPTRKVRVAPEVMDHWWTRDSEGHRLRVDWGEPDADGFYEPTVTVDYADVVTLDEKRLARALHETRINCWTNDVCLAEHDEAAAAIAKAYREATDDR